MTPKERQHVRNLIEKNNGDKLAGVAEFLGKDAQEALKGAAKGIAAETIKYPVGWDAAFHNIIDEVDRYADDDDAAEVNAASAAASGDGTTSAKGGEGGNS